MRFVLALRSLIAASLLCVASTSALASNKGGLRLICDGEFRNSDVYINNKPSGSCPADIEVSAGTIELRVTKIDSSGVQREYKESFSIAPNSVRRVEVVRANTRAVVNHTKDETISWITNKLQQQIDGARDSGGSRLFGVKVRIDDAQLDVAYTAGPCSQCGPDGISTVFAYRIPINEINKVAVSSSEFCRGAGSIRFDIPRNCKNCMVSTDGGVYVPFGSGFDICIRNSEDNLSERFNDAVQHLKTFYPPPKRKNEAF